MVDEGLTEEEVGSLRTLAFAVEKFEPFPASVISAEMLARLVRAGLVETGRSCRPAVGALGYRLTDEGWRVARAKWHWAGAPAEGLAA